ncbi:MAG: hypothetical protein QXW38_08445 [Candidatus Nitrosotenuis sp.]
MASPIEFPSVPNEVWVKGEKNSVFLEMLLSIGKEYNLTIWYNGVKIHEAVEERKDGCPKA